MSNFLKKFPWQESVLVAILILFDLAVHPLVGGPDRLVHDPAVYRLGNPNYLPGDWYTDMAVKSQVYIFYAKLVNFWHVVHIPEELWRSLLYLTSLVIMYYAIVKIAKIFTKNILVVPVLALLHAFLNTGVNQPPWLYGSFLQVDGGLAPRSIGIALSFLALFFLTQNSLLVASAILGIATLIHVSNSFIVFTLFLAVWIFYSWITSQAGLKERLRTIGKKAVLSLVVYLFLGGWFAFYVASQGRGAAQVFTPEKFIWTWIYFRAPYLALPSGAFIAKLRFFVKVVVIAFSGLWLRKITKSQYRKPLDILGLIWLGAMAYFFIFYFFSFVYPWLPGFQFYSIRIVYFVYFVTFLVLALLLVKAMEVIFLRIAAWLKIPSQRQNVMVMSLSSLLVASVILWSPSRRIFAKPTCPPLGSSWCLLQNQAKGKVKPPQTATFQYIYTQPEPVLAPVYWNTSSYYLPTIASFKSFGFTEEGLVEWFSRMNDISQGELEKTYEAQVKSGHFSPVSIDWQKAYSSLTPQDVLNLANKYNFQLFIAYRNTSYPFPALAEDESYRLYQLPINKVK